MIISSPGAKRRVQNRVVGPPTVSGRYWRLYTTANQGVLGNTVVEFTYYDMAGTPIDTFTNRTTAATASSTVNSSNTPWFAFDLNLVTKWSASAIAGPWWLRYDFGIPVTIGSVKIRACIAGQEAYASRDFVFESASSAGGPWTQVGPSITGEAWTAGQERTYILQ
jgi:hypothetical protein